MLLLHEEPKFIVKERGGRTFAFAKNQESQETRIEMTRVKVVLHPPLRPPFDFTSQIIPSSEKANLLEAVFKGCIQRNHICRQHSLRVAIRIG